MTVSGFYRWLNTLDKSTLAWPQLKPRLLENNSMLEHFLGELANEIYEWITSSDKEHLPEKINHTLGLVERFQTPYTVKAARNFIISIIQRGNRSGLWNLPVPQLSVLTFRQQNPFQANALSNYGYYQPLFQKFLENIPSQSKYHDLSSDEKIGQALFSAAYLGGLVRKDLLEALVVNAQRYQYSKNYAWIDFIDNESIYFRWHPDPISEYLFSKSILTLENQIEVLEAPAVVSRCINAYIRTLSTNFNYTFSNLLEAAKIHYHVNLPSVVAYHLQNPKRSTPLPENAWRRYRNAGVINKEESSRQEGEVHSDYYEAVSYPISKPVDLLASNQRSLLNKFRKNAFKQEQPGKKISQQVFANRCFEFINKNANDLAPALFYLVQWLDSMVKSGLKVSSAQTYLSQVNGLIDHLSNISFHSIDSQTLLEQYNAYIIEKREKSTLNNAKNIATRIKSFQIFVFLYADAPEIPFDEIAFYEAKSSSRVNANLLSEKEVEQIKQLLLDLDTNLYFLFILAVRTGVRIGEVLHIQLKHIVGEEANSPLYLFIQTTDFHNTKTASSRRKIPLKKFLPEEEYMQFLEFYRLRKQTMQALLQSEYLSPLSETKRVRKQFLFSDEANAPLTHTIIYQSIQPLLKEVSRDASVTFHTLRHTFANNQLLKIFFDEFSKQRDNLKSFSYEIGHLTPEETLKSYFHLMPIVVNHFLTQNLSSLLSMSATDICRQFELNDQKFVHKVYKKGQSPSNYFKAAISYFRNEHLQRYKELKHKQKPGVKKVFKQNKTTWMHPKILYICITKEVNEAFLTKLAQVNKRDPDFYLKVHAIKEMLQRKVSSGARGVSWPQGMKEERQLLETYRAIESLSEIQRKKFQALFASNHDKKNIIFETFELMEAVKICQFAAKIKGKGNLIVRLTPSKTQNAPSAEEQAEIWLKNLTKNGVAVDSIWIKGHVHPVKMVNTSRKHSYGKVAISVNDGHNNASHGFKMGIVLALTYLHYFVKK